MFKKVLGVTLLVGLVAVLIFGAINRTQAKGSRGEAGNLGAHSNPGRQGYASGQGYRANQANGVVSPRGSRWSQPVDEVTLGKAYQFNPSGSGYSRGRGGGDPTTGNPQAEVEEWLNLEGVVTGVDPTLLSVTLEDGSLVEINGRAWTFAQENGFSPQVGDRLLLTGFYENADLEVGAIQNLATGTSIQIRQENGRPLWAGRGRQG